MNTASLVLTTIFDHDILESYYDNFQKFDRLNNVNIFIIPDLKTPSTIFSRCKSLQKRGLRVVCPTVEEQEDFLNKIGFNSHLVPYNSDNRRNIGFLMALESGSDFLISIDDDNYCLEDEDFIKEHEIVCCEPFQTSVTNSDTGWFNICEQLQLSPDIKTYPRGFPYYARHKEPVITNKLENIAIHMNAGLWLIDPDVDAISWLVNPATSLSFKGESLILGRKTWTPVNTQNTSMRRDVVASYYYFKMQYPIGGLKIDRYGDILSGYFSQACVKNMGGSVRVGTPVATHRRNSHNFMNDALNEWGGIMVLEELLPWLTTASELEGSTYSDKYIFLSELLRESVENFKGKIWTDDTKAYFHQMSFYMRQWAVVCKQFL